MNKRSPFPGMDPWLELRWGDVHTGLCVGISAALQPALPIGVQAVIQTEEEKDERETDYLNDRTDRFRFDAVQTRRRIEVIDTKSRDRVITAIEVLRPGNKCEGRLNRECVRRMDDYVAAGANTVEIDLLRSSRDHLAVNEERITPIGRADYYVVVNRAAKPNQYEAYPMKLRQQHAKVPVPLREDDPDVLLELQPVIDRIYLEGGHYHTDYTARLPRPLIGDDARWAQVLVSMSRG